MLLDQWRQWGLFRGIVRNLGLAGALRRSCVLRHIMHGSGNLLRPAWQGFAEQGEHCFREF